MSSILLTLLWAANDPFVIVQVETRFQKFIYYYLHKGHTRHIYVWHSGRCGIQYIVVYIIIYWYNRHIIVLHNIII